MSAPSYSRPAFLNALRQAAYLSDAAVRLALVIDGYAGRDGTCWPFQPTLAGDLGWSLSKAKRNMAELQRAGVIVYLKRAKNQHERSLIRLAVPATSGGGESDTSTDGFGGVTTDTEVVSDLNFGGVRSDTQNQSMNQPIEPTHVRTGSTGVGQGQEPTQHPDYIAFCETAHRTFGDTLWTRVQADNEPNKVKFRTAVMEQVEAGADPRLLAKTVCEQDVRDADSIVALLAWRVKRFGPDVVRQTKVKADTSKLLGFAPYEAVGSGSDDGEGAA